MNIVNITEQYALCMLKEKKDFARKGIIAIFNCINDSRNDA